MMPSTPIDANTVRRFIDASGLKDLGRASIREIVRLVNGIEQATGAKYIRMEMGVPGLPPPEVGTRAEIAALSRGVASKYPMIEGVAELKHEFARFLKLFVNAEVRPEGCVPTVGSMQGGFAAFMILSKCRKGRDTTLFIDPGFPVQKQQHEVLGIPYVSFDVSKHRGEKLRDKLGAMLESGRISSILYSNPNNPSWLCLADRELRIIAELAKKHDAVVIEDLAYFAMDFREDLSKPGEPPYQPSIARYAEDYILLVSSSKCFSYAGQRIAMMAVSDHLFDRRYPDLDAAFRTDRFGHALIYRVIYSLSAGTSHSAQFAMAAMLKAANEGRYNFVADVKEYGERARLMKKLFTENGFAIVYDKDEERPLADGFYFTVAYPGMTGGRLIEQLLYYGISAIGLATTGSDRHEGLRACVSQTGRERLPELEERLRRFNADHRQRAS